MKRRVAFWGICLVVLTLVAGCAGVQPAPPWNDGHYSTAPPGVPIRPDQGRF